jgi:hypothetical protein
MISALPTAHAVLVRERDWQQVPEAQRDQFAEIGRCVVQREPALRTLDISKNLEPALLLVRRSDDATLPSTQADH